MGERHVRREELREAAERRDKKRRGEAAVADGTGGLAARRWRAWVGRHGGYREGTRGNEARLTGGGGPGWVGTEGTGRY